MIFRQPDGHLINAILVIDVSNLRLLRIIVLQSIWMNTSSDYGLKLEEQISPFIGFKGLSRLNRNSYPDFELPKPT